MKIIVAFLLLSIVTLAVNAQQLPAKLTDQPDGVTLSYFNTAADSCFSEIFIGDSLQILFPCYSKKDYRRVDISAATAAIKRIRAIVTTGFIVKMLDCCRQKNCPDTSDGYFIWVKKGAGYKFLALDIAFSGADKCGNDDLQEVIRLMNKISSTYR